jgi:polynucleotide 5'-hydroxyl-kinase GRC3/NOL9
MVGKLEDFIKETQIIEELSNSQNKLIMVIGGVDTGKTTLIECIADFLAKQTRVAIVDLDMGQSHIGLPTTIAWGKIKGGFKSWDSIPVEDFYFTGTLSPPGNLVPTIVGAKLITDKAISTSEKVIVDTTGLIAGPAGRLLKQFKIDLLCPDIILALERSGELGHILDTFKPQKSPKVYRLSVPPGVSSKTVPIRAQYRAECFNSYFKDAETIEVLLKDVGIRFTKEPIRLSTVYLKDRIVSFRDERNRDMALGIIEQASLKYKKLLIRSPIKRDVKFSTIMIGTVTIEL